MTEQTNLLALLARRFEENQANYSNLTWEVIEENLRKQPEVLIILAKMEETGGEPAVVGIDPKSEAVLFFDCSIETPNGRRSLCYDEMALNARKKNKPESSVEQVATDLGLAILNETDYAYLQTLGDFDNKTSSWILTPAEVRGRGGALFGDKRYGRVFIYHNGADSYYASRGFRGKVLLQLIKSDEKEQ